MPTPKVSTLSWTPSTNGADDYLLRVFRDGASLGTDTTTELHYDLAHDPDHDQIVYVQGRNDLGLSQPATIVLPAAPLIPDPVVAPTISVDPGDGQATVTQTGAGSGYEILDVHLDPATTDGTASFQDVTLPFVVPNLVNDTTYTVVVDASADTRHAHSNSVTVTPATQGAPRTITYTFDAASEAADWDAPNATKTLANGKLTVSLANGQSGVSSYGALLVDTQTTTGAVALGVSGYTSESAGAGGLLWAYQDAQNFWCIDGAGFVGSCVQGNYTKIDAMNEGTQASMEVQIDADGTTRIYYGGVLKKTVQTTTRYGSKLGVWAGPPVSLDGASVTKPS